MGVDVLGSPNNGKFMYTSTSRNTPFATYGVPGKSDGFVSDSLASCTEVLRNHTTVLNRSPKPGASETSLRIRLCMRTRTHDLKNGGTNNGSEKLKTKMT